MNELAQLRKDAAMDDSLESILLDAYKLLLPKTAGQSANEVAARIESWVEFRYECDRGRREQAQEQAAEIFKAKSHE